MNSRSFVAIALAAPLACLSLAGCTTPMPTVEVTRFHEQAALPILARGTIAVEAAPGMDPSSLELASYETAVGRELSRIGYRTVAEGTGDQVALVRVSRRAFRPEKRGGPVSVGVGGSAGSWGSGVGVGIGIDLSGKPPELVTTELGVMIRNRASGETIWEGRANFTVRGDAPLATTQLGAAKMAEAMFKDFPGNNGETVEVK